MTMRAFRVTSHDAPPALATCARPRPGPGQMRLKIHACGLNFADLLMMSGRYQDTPALPFTLGMEVSGVVDALGPAQPPEALAIGSRALVYCGHGGLAD